MTVKQIVLGVKNRQGELSRIIGHLYENDVRVCAFWAGTENKKATLRFIASDPEAAISKITSYDQARKMLTESAAWLKENAGEERFVAYRMLVGIAAVDGDLSSKEEEFLYEVADLLDIPRKAAKKIVRQILSKYVKARQFTAPDMQEFSVPK